MNPSPTGYWSQRLQGAVPWRTLFWRDVMAVGSTINLFTGFAALFLISQGQPIAWALVVHFSPAPYNAFLLYALWRIRTKPAWTMPAACAWFVGMLVV